ncbi:hypothetical protein CIE84_15535 [Salmonella enterica]|nr:hypothetical protein [Salmonella enterica]EDM0667863.1 hypothetical protein [Salmonella enterica]
MYLHVWRHTTPKNGALWRLIQRKKRRKARLSSPVTYSGSHARLPVEGQRRKYTPRRRKSARGL